MKAFVRAIFPAIKFRVIWSALPKNFVAPPDAFIRTASVFITLLSPPDSGIIDTMPLRSPLNDVLSESADGITPAILSRRPLNVGRSDLILDPSSESNLSPIPSSVSLIPPIRRPLISPRLGIFPRMFGITLLICDEMRCSNWSAITFGVSSFAILSPSALIIPPNPFPPISSLLRSKESMNFEAKSSPISLVTTALRASAKKSIFPPALRAAPPTATIPSRTPNRTVEYAFINPINPLVCNLSNPNAA